MVDAIKKTPALQWSTGGWFGAQIGSTLWVLIMSALLLSANSGMAAAVFVAYLIPNIVGVGLWTQRHRVGAYLAFQLLIAVTGVCAFTAVQMIDAAGLWDTVSGVKINDSGVTGADGTVSAHRMKLTILIGAPLMMAFFELIRRQKNRQLGRR